MFYYLYVSNVEKHVCRENEIVIYVTRGFFPPKNVKFVDSQKIIFLGLHICKYICNGSGHFFVLGGKKTVLKLRTRTIYVSFNDNALGLFTTPLTIWPISSLEAIVIYS